LGCYYDEKMCKDVINSYPESIAENKQNGLTPQQTALQIWDAYASQSAFDGPDVNF
jgi:hypothetical protein